MPLSKPRIILLSLTVASANAIWGVCAALLPPFFPTEAKSKGATESHAGLIFGIYSLVGCIASPLFGKYGSNFSPGFLYIPGAIIQAISTLSFGVLHYIDNLGLFLSLAYMLRMISGAAMAAVWGSLMAALMTLFPDKVSKVVATTVLSFGIGYMLGPALSGLLFITGGFVLPFVFGGSMAMLLVVFLFLAIPKVNVMQDDEIESKTFSTVRLLKIPGVILPMVDCFAASFSLNMVEAMLGLHLKSIGATIDIISAAFFISGGGYMLSTFASGFTTDTSTYPKILSILGNIGLVIAFTSIGPLPFIPRENGIPIILISFAIIGFCTGLVCVSSFTRAQRSAIVNGFPQDTKTYHIISGLWVSFDFMGAFLGPSIGGIAVEWWRFRTATMIYWTLHLIMLVVDIIDLKYQFGAKNNSFPDVKYAKLQTKD